jgi:hypothetical protein
MTGEAFLSLFYEIDKDPRARGAGVLVGLFVFFRILHWYLLLKYVARGTTWTRRC